MPTFTFHDQNVAANATTRPLQDDSWQFRRLPWPAFVEMSIISDEIGFLYTFYSGSDTLAQEQPVSAAGTDGHLPDMDKPLHEDLAAAFDELTLIIRETQASGTGDVMGWVRLTQIG